MVGLFLLPAGLRKRINWRKKVKSGIDVIDETIGYLRDGECYLLRGETGTGKTVMALQFLYDGIKRGEVGLYITDEKPKDLLCKADSLGMDLRSPLGSGKLCILELAECYVNLVDRHTDILALMDDLKTHIDRLDVKRLVIDQAGTLFNLNQSQQFLQGFAGSLLNFICDLPSTCMLIESADPGENGDWQRKLLERVAFGIFHLGWNENRSLRSLTVKKMRGTQFDPIPQSYVIDDGAGITRRGESPRFFHANSAQESGPEEEGKGLTDSHGIQDLPAISFDIQSGIFSLTLDQERRIIDTMNMVEELGVHFSLVIIKIQQGNGIKVYDQTAVEEMMERARELIISQCRDEDILVRARNGELILVLVGADHGGVRKFMIRIESRMRDIRSEKVGITLNYNHGYASYPHDSAQFHEVIDLALKSMSHAIQLRID